MQSEDIFALGLGLKSPWKLMGQRFDMDKQPHELHLLLGAERGALYPCPVCGALCKAHDFQEMSWRHLNFFQHLCILTANVPRVSEPILEPVRNALNTFEEHTHPGFSDIGIHY